MNYSFNDKRKSFFDISLKKCDVVSKERESQVNTVWLRTGLAGFGQGGNSKSMTRNPPLR